MSGDDPDKEVFREVVRELRPDIAREDFDKAWERFVELKAKAAAMLAAGIALHPTFGREP